MVHEVIGCASVAEQLASVAAKACAFAVDGALYAVQKWIESKLETPSTA